MTYNKAEIMKTAWQKYNRLKAMNMLSYYDGSAMMAAGIYSSDSEAAKAFLVTTTFGDVLKQAWADAREIVEHQRKQAKIAHAIANNAHLQAEIAKIDDAIFYHSMKDMWNSKDWEYSRKLNAQRQAILDGIAAA